MTVLNFHSDRHPTAAVDIFASDPFDFDAENARTAGGAFTRYGRAFCFDSHADRDR